MARSAVGARVSGVGAAGGAAGAVAALGRARRGALAGRGAGHGRR